MVQRSLPSSLTPPSSIRSSWASGCSSSGPVGAPRHAHSRSHSSKSFYFFFFKSYDCKRLRLPQPQPHVPQPRALLETQLPSPSPFISFNSPRVRRADGCCLPDLPPATSDDNINLGEKDSIRRRALWALEGKPDLAFSKVEIPDISTADMDKMLFDLCTYFSCRFILILTYPSLEAVLWKCT